MYIFFNTSRSIPYLLAYDNDLANKNFCGDHLVTLQFVPSGIDIKQIDKSLSLSFQFFFFLNRYTYMTEVFLGKLNTIIFRMIAIF